ncbi:MAG: hypothetical protein ABSG53_21315 [Thermoguttaceae bacterium]
MGFNHRVVGGPHAIGVGEGRDVRRLAGNTFDQVLLQFLAQLLLGKARWWSGGHGRTFSLQAGQQ